MVIARRDTRQRSVLILILVTSLVIVTLDSRGSGIIDTIRGAARDVIAPVQDGVDTAFSPVTNVVDGITSYDSVKSENERLKKQIDDLRGRLRRNRAVGANVEQIEKLVDLPRIEDVTGIAARVVGGAPGNFERTLQLDRGTNAGIEVGLPVVTGGGIVGKITEASRSRSTVTLIDNPGGPNVGVRLEKTNTRGIAEGRAGEHDLRLGFLSDVTAKVTKGELVFTSDTEDAVFPPDLPVGKVVKYEFPQGDLEPQITIRPVVNLDDLRYVKVLRITRTQSQPSSGG